MGKKRVQSRQVRQMRQVRQVRPKAVPQPTAGGDQRKQRQQYVEAGGMLQGYAPQTVLRIGYIAGAGALGCVVVAALLFLLLPYGLPVRIAAAAVWLVPIVFGASFILPGYTRARKDMKAEPTVVQGQLLGASEVSTSLGLGMLMLKPRVGGVQQFLVTPERLARVPGNQVNVMLSVTRHLKHVRSVAVVGQRVVARPEQSIPPVVRRLRLLPIVTPVALASAAIVGVDVVSLLPIQGDLVHTVAAVVTGALLAGVVYGVSFVFQRRLYKQVQELMPGAMG